MYMMQVPTYCIFQFLLPFEIVGIDLYHAAKHNDFKHWSAEQGRTLQIKHSQEPLATINDY